MERRFVKDYKLEDNKPVYTGSFYYADITAKRRVLTAAVGSAAAGLYMAAAFAGNMMTRWWPLGVPFILLFIFVCLFCYEAGRFYKLPEQMERRHYEGAFLHIGAYAFLNFIFSAASAVIGAVWLFNTKDAAWPEYFAPVFCAGIAVISISYFNVWRRMHKK